MSTSVKPRGRPARINRDEIVAAAAEIGLARFSMDAVAGQLGVTTPALYSHVSGRDEIVRLAAAEVVRSSAHALDGCQTWEAWLSGWARVLRSELGSVGGDLIDALGVDLELGSLDVASHGLQLLFDAGLPLTDAGLVLWLVARVACSSGTSEEASVQVATDAARSVLTATTAPVVAEAIGAADRAGADAAFDFDLDVLLRGIAARLAS